MPTQRCELRRQLKRPPRVNANLLMMWCDKTKKKEGTHHSLWKWRSRQIPPEFVPPYCWMHRTGVFYFTIFKNRWEMHTQVLQQKEKPFLSKKEKTNQQWKEGIKDCTVSRMSLLLNWTITIYKKNWSLKESLGDCEIYNLPQRCLSVASGPFIFVLCQRDVLCVFFSLFCSSPRKWRNMMKCISNTLKIELFLIKFLCRFYFFKNFLIGQLTEKCQMTSEFFFQ